MKKFALIMAFAMSGVNAFGQGETQEAPENWFNLDPATDKVQGISTEKAYQTILKGKQGQTVIVAVIDSGVDTNHEDLKDIIWVNEGEIPGNGIDDDKNGYIDDIHGWNFIGNANGENISIDSYELTREYVRLKKYFADKDTLKLSKKDVESFNAYKKIKKSFESDKKKNQAQFQQFSGFVAAYRNAQSNLKSELNVEEITDEALDTLDISNPSYGQSVQIMKAAKMYGLDDEQIAEGEKYFDNLVNYAYNEDFDPRSLVGDNYSDVNERSYGNPDVIGSDASHGTHVSGIIAAVRNNGIGIDGINDKVKIMAIRAVPDGDERDKDVANAIYYAVDNGAKVINMSFGKSFSPEKAAVDKAVKYADKKGVILVHAAGNSSKDIDVKDNFPTRNFSKKGSAVLWIEVGASSWGEGDNFIGSFSNYGKKTVDIFAPGVDIQSTTPDNSYSSFQGTSMASPMTAGLAALLISYYPNLKPADVVSIIMQTGRKFEGLEVTKPGSEEKINFSELSKTGGIINVYEAVKMAEGMSIKSK